MQAAGWGRIVTISSSSAQSGAPERAHYVASKGDVIALTKALAYELSPQGITVNTIPPSIVDTPMAQAGVKVGTVPFLDILATMVPVRAAPQTTSPPPPPSSAVTTRASSPAKSSASTVACTCICICKSLRAPRMTVLSSGSRLLTPPPSSLRICGRRQLTFHSMRIPHRLDTTRS
jgi:NAD(P)-dependent dehydrogenase (short-subunit alcohol dehydrogenase family)